MALNVMGFCAASSERKNLPTLMVDFLRAGLVGPEVFELLPIFRCLKLFLIVLLLGNVSWSGAAPITYNINLTIGGVAPQSAISLLTVQSVHSPRQTYWIGI